MASPFNLHATQSDSDGMQDDFASDSDFEHLNTNADMKTPQALHSWYGRQILRQHFVSQIAKSASISTSAVQLDWSLIQAEASCPYVDILSKLRQFDLLDIEADHLSPEDGGFTECINRLGSAALARTDQPGWASDFLAGVTEAPSAPQSGLTGRSRVHDVRSTSGLTACVDQPLSDDLNVPRYTMMMNEIGQAQDRKPQYDSRTLSINPPEFEAVLQFGGTEYKAKASTKQKAKNLVSRKACLENGYRL